MYLVRMICTDGGTHPSRELGSLALVEPEPEVYEVLRAEAGPEFTPQEVEALHEYERLSSMGSRLTARERHRPGRAQPMAPRDNRLVDEVGHQTWHFACPTCGRDTEMGRNTTIKLVEGLARAGESRCDISHLPF